MCIRDRSLQIYRHQDKEEFLAHNSSKLQVSNLCLFQQALCASVRVSWFNFMDEMKICHWPEKRSKRCTCSMNVYVKRQVHIACKKHSMIGQISSRTRKVSVHVVKMPNGVPCSRWISKDWYRAWTCKQSCKDIFVDPWMGQTCPG